jgi:hypothetical protein
VIATGGEVSRLRLKRGFNTSPTRAAAKALDRDEYFVAYDASSGPFRTADNGIVVVSRLKLTR